jgi:glycosyltransferase involved in cell wall biosynthesis
VTARPARVAFLVACHNVGGFETKLDHLIRHLDRRRAVPAVVLLYPAYKARRTEEEVRLRQRAFFQWPGVETVEIPMRTRFDAGAALRSASALRRLKPDAVLFFALGPGTFAGPVAARFAGVRSVIRCQDTVLDGLYPAALRSVDRLLLRRTDRVAVPSAFLKDLLVRDLGVEPGRVDVIPNGIDLSAFARVRPDAALRRSLGPGIGPGDRLIGLVANLVPVKNHRLLLAAAPEVLKAEPRARFLLIGDGPLRPELEALAESLGVSRAVRFLGYRNDVRRLIPLLDAGLLCSRVETHGIALIEMMAAGVPVVAPAVGGIPEIVRDGADGLLVPPDDAGALARALIRVLRDRGLAARLAAAGRRTAFERFPVSAMVRGFEALIGAPREEA